VQKRIPGGDIAVDLRDGLIRARGLPYGRVTRFDAATPASDWSGVYDATRPGPVCPQRPSRLSFVTGPILGDLVVDEDCLVVSVTAPENADGLPVMVWFHGGAYVAGGGESPKYDAGALVREGGVVVVSVTYRLGVFGYLAPPDAGADDNLGLRDQILALRWVRDNVAAFGGDPGNVTVFGQSAGGDSVLGLMLCVDAAGLFHRAVVQSAPLGIGTQNADVGADRAAMATALQEAMAESLGGVAARDATRDQLLTAEGAAVAAAQGFGMLGGMAFAPLLGRDPLPSAADVPERIADAAGRIELLIGHTKDDASPFVAMDTRVKTLGVLKAAERLAIRAIAPAITQRMFGGLVEPFAATWREHGGRVSTYRFDWSPSDAPLGACHCMELPLLFECGDVWADAPMLGPGGAIDRELAARVRALWTGFAHRGVDGLAATMRIT
jgi:para-nitrobenzyl esterase